MTKNLGSNSRGFITAFRNRILDSGTPASGVVARLTFWMSVVFWLVSEPVCAAPPYFNYQIRPLRANAEFAVPCQATAQVAFASPTVCTMYPTVCTMYPTVCTMCPTVCTMYPPVLQFLQPPVLPDVPVVPSVTWTVSEHRHMCPQVPLVSSASVSATSGGDRTCTERKAPEIPPEVRARMRFAADLAALAYCGHDNSRIAVEGGFQRKTADAGDVYSKEYNAFSDIPQFEARSPFPVLQRVQEDSCTCGFCFVSVFLKKFSKECSVWLFFVCALMSISF